MSTESEIYVRLARVESAINRILTKLVIEPEERAAALIAERKAETQLSIRFVKLLNDADKKHPGLRNSVMSTYMDATMAAILLDMDHPIDVLEYLYQGPGRPRLAKVTALKGEDLRHELIAIERRVKTVKSIALEAIKSVSDMGLTRAQKGARKQGPETK